MNAQQAKSLATRHANVAARKREEEEKRRKREDEEYRKKTLPLAKEFFEKQFPALVRVEVKKGNNYVYLSDDMGNTILSHVCDLAESAGYKVEHFSYSEHDSDGVPTGEGSWWVHICW